jgi:hypothetical protein
LSVMRMTQKSPRRKRKPFTYCGGNSHTNTNE